MSNVDYKFLLYWFLISVPSSLVFAFLGQGANFSSLLLLFVLSIGTGFVFGSFIIINKLKKDINSWLKELDK